MMSEELSDEEAAALASEVVDSLRQSVEPEMFAWLSEGIEQASKQLGESCEAWRGALFVAGWFGEVLRPRDDDEVPTSREAITHALIALLCNSPGARLALGWPLER